mmetsp:Transcript_28663/g.42197  ORF Transcript_28663/g.42197 Transcript_28663/m.42197 type:complete len:162 (-) Transcript_28663:1191-1676(-)
MKAQKWKLCCIILQMLHFLLPMFVFVAADDGGMETKENSNRRYPHDALRCFATLAEPNHKILCPESRNNYCIKEVANTTRRYCGSTIAYPNDVWDIKLGQCIYRKCAASCPNRTKLFGSGEKTYGRRSYCCNTDLCNEAGQKGRHFLVYVLSLVVMTILLT